MENVKMTLVLPGLIDGDPPQVDALVRRAIYGAMDEFAEWIDGCAKQIANAERTKILERDPALAAEALAKKYDESDTAESLGLLTDAAKALVSAAAELTR